MKLELVLKKELLQSGCELAPEDATQRGDGQEESSRGGDPSGTVGCKTASRNHVVYVPGTETKKMMVENARGGEAEYGCRPGCREKAEPTPLRNEAPLNCVALRSELDCK